MYKNLVLLICMILLARIESRTINNGKGKTKSLDIAKFIKRLLQDTAIFDKEKGITAAGLEGCKDEVSWCEIYKEYCYHDTVVGYCQSTCNKCPVITTASTCEDKVDNCAVGVGFGYCTGNEVEQNYMRSNCAKSCGFCTVPTTTCEDKQSVSYCIQIKRLGHCTNEKYQDHFKKFCAATCEHCQPSCGFAKMRELAALKALEAAAKNGNTKEEEGGGVVAGQDASKGFYPWQVAIYHNEKFLCGGSLIGKTKVVTAAHCFNHRSKDVREYEVVLGEHNREYPEGTEQAVNVNKIIIHEDYDFNADDHDIAILILSEDAKTGKYIYPICLPEKNIELEPDRRCMLTGWGKVVHVGQAVQKLQEVQLPIADRGVCENRNNFNFHKVTEKMICAGYSDGSSFASGCHGDSGGPLQCEENGAWKLYGVVSWGSPQCNGLDRFTVFTRVSLYIDWINNQS